MDDDWKLVKLKPRQLWMCNTFHMNGCEKYCTEYVKGTDQQGCKHYQALCRPFEMSLTELLS